MEPDIPGELDVTSDSTHGNVVVNNSSELKDALILIGEELRGGQCVLGSRVLKVLTVSVVERGDLSLDVTVLLHRIGNVVLLRGEDREGRHRWC